jgi:hypothetical protein
MNEQELRLKAIEIALRHHPNSAKWAVWGLADDILAYVAGNEPTPEKPEFKPFIISVPPTRWEAFINRITARGRF